MDLLGGFSYLQLFWGLQTLVVGANTLHMISKGNYWDKSFGDRNPDDEFGLLQFKKRIAQYYFLALVWTAWVGSNVFTIYCFGSSAGEWFNNLLTAVTSPRHYGVDSTCVLLAVLMYESHLMRRFYESFYVSIFSRRQVLSPIGVLLNFAYYLAVAFSLVADGPALNQQEACVSLSSFGLRHLVAVGLFVWASRVHHLSHQQLAKLRKNRAGHVVTTSYKMPKDGWFDYISCPHYLAEIVIYSSIGLVLGLGASTWWWLVAYVFTNQFFLSYSTHTWYQKKFGDYPNERKMLIPFIL